MEIEKHAHSVGQDLANESILQVPQITHTDPRHCKVLSQLGPNGFDNFALMGTRSYQGARLSRRHTRPRFSTMLVMRWRCCGYVSENYHMISPL